MMTQLSDSQHVSAGTAPRGSGESLVAFQTTCARDTVGLSGVDLVLFGPHLQAKVAQTASNSACATNPDAENQRRRLEQLQSTIDVIESTGLAGTGDDEA